MLKRLTDNILYSDHDPRTDRPILAAVLGRDRVLMVDAGASRAHTHAFLDALARETGRQPDWVAVTHWHWDHSFGMAYVGAPTIGHLNLTKNLVKLQGLAWDDAALAERVARRQEISFCAEHIAVEYGDSRDIEIVLPDITFERSMTLDLGGIACKLRHIPTVHCDDAVALFVVEDSVLFVGDAMGEEYYAWPTYYSAGLMDQLVTAIRRFPATTYVESHCDPMDAAGFWADNQILVTAAEMIRVGITSRDSLLAAVRDRLSDSLPDDHEEIIDKFLRCPA